jgi:glycosyltransferase involved in cell wall biosynthesis
MALDELVSAIIPVYNGGRFLRDAIQSVLDQDYPSIECIVVNDGSMDDSEAVAASFGSRVRCLTKPNGGVASARNFGIDASTGQMIAFLDADDYWATNKITKQVALLRRQDCGMVYSGIVVSDQELAPIEKVPPPTAVAALRNSLLLEFPYMAISSTALVRREVALGVGGFDETLSTSADTDFACRVALNHKVAPVDGDLVLYRMHADQMHHDAARMERDMVIVFQKLFQSGVLPDDLLRLEGRARANLYASLAGHYLQRRDRRLMVRYLARALRWDAGRTLSLILRKTRLFGTGSSQPRDLPQGTGG